MVLIQSSEKKTDIHVNALFKFDQIDLYFTFSFPHSCPPIAVVLARRRMAGERVETCDQLEFDVVEVADTMGWQLPLVKRGLRQLQWSTGKGMPMQ